MSRKSSPSIASLLLAISLFLAACSSAPTAAPAGSPTTVPMASPSSTAVDWNTLLASFLVSMPADSYLISPAALNGLIQAGKAPFIVDVRDPSEIGQSGYIQGAVNIPLRSLLQNLDLLPGLQAPIVVHCSIGHRGAMAMMALRLLGYTNVLSLDGGFSDWTAANMPIVSGTPPAPVAGTAAVVDPSRLVELDAFLTALPSDFYGITDTTLLQAINSGAPPVIIDVRTPTEVAATGFIAGSVFIPLNSLLSDMSRIPTDKTATIYTISSDGQNGSVAAMALHLLGYTRASSMYFGFNGWVSGKLPVQK